MAFQQKVGVTVEDVASFSPPLTYFRSPLIQSEDPDTINQGFHKFSPDFIPFKCELDDGVKWTGTR